MEDLSGFSGVITSPPPKRAERRLGEMMAEQKAAVAFNKGGGDQKSDHQGTRNPSDPPTLSQAGIDKHLRRRASYDEPTRDDRQPNGAVAASSSGTCIN